MVPRSQAACQTEPWKQALATAFTAVDPLLESLGLTRAQIPDLDPDPASFRLRVPRGFAALMRPGDPCDPLLRQVLPLGIEQASVTGFITDPVGDAAALWGPGLLRKYPGRALLITTAACAIHCRYCFRRHLGHAELGRADARQISALNQIAETPAITEVILSGGDPLLLDDAPLDALLDRLDAIPHLQRLRLHTRLPVVLPERITDRLCARLATTRLRVVVVIHANHPAELAQGTAEALQKLRQHGIPLLNQSVLLHGVNDAADVLETLSERLFVCGVLPYYLHQLDPVQGAAHFQVSDEQARRLISALRARLPGYLVPRLVREVPGASSKLPLDS